MRSLSIVLILGALTACASSGGYLEYKPDHWEGLNWAITGRADADTVIIKINDTDVIFGDLTKQKPEDEFTGSFQGYNISAKCKLVNAGTDTAKHNCSVSVDDKLAGKLTF